MAQHDAFSVTRSLRWLMLASMATYRKSVWFLRGFFFFFFFFYSRWAHVWLMIKSSSSTNCLPWASMCKTREVAHYTCAFQVKMSTVEAKCSPSLPVRFDLWWCWRGTAGWRAALCCLLWFQAHLRPHPAVMSRRPAAHLCIPAATEKLEVSAGCLCRGC